MTTFAGDADIRGPFKFERRRADRWSVDGEATAFCLAAESFGAMYELRLLDTSDGGIGAMSDAPITPGSVVSVGFSMPGTIARQGTVVRCLPAGDGYRVAIRFDLRLAA